MFVVAVVPLLLTIPSAFSFEIQRQYKRDHHQTCYNHYSVEVQPPLIKFDYYWKQKISFLCPTKEKLIPTFVTKQIRSLSSLPSLWGRTSCSHSTWCSTESFSNCCPASSSLSSQAVWFTPSTRQVVLSGFIASHSHFLITVFPAHLTHNIKLFAF